MLNNNADGLLVARICHDLKNCLSVIAFQKEDLADGAVDLQTGVNNIISGVDNLSLRLSFFQNLVVDGSHIGNLYEILKQMCVGSSVSLIFDIDINTNISGQLCSEQNIICGILYLIVVDALRSKVPQTIVVSKDLREDVVNIFISGITMDNIPREIIDIAEMNEVVATVVNALALYVRRLMKRNGYSANVFDTGSRINSDEVGVKIVLAKLT